MIDSDNILPPGKRRRRAPPVDPCSSGAGFSALADAREELDVLSGGWTDDVIALLFRTRRGADGQLWLTGSSPALDALALSNKRRLRASVPLREVFETVKPEEGTTGRVLQVPCDVVPCFLCGPVPDQRWPVVVSIGLNGRGLALPADGQCREQLLWEVTAAQHGDAEEVSDSEGSDLGGFIVGTHDSSLSCCAEHEHLRAFASEVLDDGGGAAQTTSSIHAAYAAWECTGDKLSASTVPVMGKILGRHPGLFAKTGARSQSRGWSLVARACSCCRK